MDGAYAKSCLTQMIFHTHVICGTSIHTMQKSFDMYYYVASIQGI